MECNSDCQSCSQTCDDYKGSSKNKPLNAIKNIYGIVSGKGGVGKSLITSMLAVHMKNKGFKVGIMDADITGPSIPKAFGLNSSAMQNENGILPVKSKSGIDIMSVNLLLEQPTDPVIWRGPLLSNVVTQFWEDVVWGELDYLFIDMPPGTGDVALTLFESVSLNGIIIVTSPQDLVSMIVQKSVKMASRMKIPILGIVENMSYFECDECNKKHYIYGESNTEKIAEEYGLEVLAKLPINSNLAKICDTGDIESFNNDLLEEISDKITL